MAKYRDVPHFPLSNYCLEENGSKEYCSRKPGHKGDCKFVRGDIGEEWDQIISHYKATGVDITDKAA